MPDTGAGYRMSDRADLWIDQNEDIFKGDSNPKNSNCFRLLNRLPAFTDIVHLVFFFQVIEK
jgi:hypothetical protein